MEQIIKTAIADKKLIEFSYSGHTRIAEPHVLGISGGATQILGYQVGGRAVQEESPNGGDLI